jgi:hypothetical protein
VCDFSELSLDIGASDDTPARIPSSVGESLGGQECVSVFNGDDLLEHRLVEDGWDEPDADPRHLMVARVPPERSASPV